MMMSVEDKKGSMHFWQKLARGHYPDSAAAIVNGALRPPQGGLQPMAGGSIRAGARAKARFRAS
jgi:hypothetical protein